MSRYERRTGIITPNAQRYDAEKAADWLDAVRRQVCPFCNEGPFTVVAQHVWRSHGLDKYQFKYLLGLPGEASVCDPTYSRLVSERAQRQRAAGTLTGPGATKGTRHTRRPPWRKRSGPWHTSHSELCPIGRGNLDGYNNHRCRCEWCTRANTLWQADYMTRHPEQREKQRIRDAQRRTIGEQGAETA